MNDYTSYYLHQAKTGVGAAHHPCQKGHGIGNFLGSVIRSIYPYIRSGLSAIKDEIFGAGVGLLSDSMKQVPFKSSLENRMRTIGTNLTDKTVKKVMSMTGSGGTKRRKMSQKSHLLSRIRKGRSSKKRVAKTVVKRKKKSVKSKKKSVKSKKKKPGLKRLKRRAKPIKKTRKKGGKTKRKQTGRGFTDIFD